MQLLEEQLKPQGKICTREREREREREKEREWTHAREGDNKVEKARDRKQASLAERGQDREREKERKIARERQREGQKDTHIHSCIWWFVCFSMYLVPSTYRRSTTQLFGCVFLVISRFSVELLEKQFVENPGKKNHPDLNFVQYSLGYYPKQAFDSKIVPALTSSVSST